MVILQFVVVLLLVLLDQLTKLWTVDALDLYQSIPIIKDVFHITYAKNTGAAFSMLQGQTIFLIIVPIIASLVMIHVLMSKRIKSKIGSWSLVLILAGAIGNLIDRLLAGAVVDMFDFTLIDFPVFNVADICVTIGAVLFFIYAIFIYKPEKKDE